MSLLEVRNLTIEAPSQKGWIRVLNEASFEISANETLGLMGPSGAGKTTLALALLRLQDPRVRILGGQILFEGRNIFEFDEGALLSYRGKQVALIFQEPYSHLNPSKTVGDQLLDILDGNPQLRLELDRTLHKQAMELFEEVGLKNPSEYFEKFPYQLSGGECQRVLIALALSCRPKLLIADEPTSSLDSITQVQIIRLLKDLQSKRKFSLLLISHDPKLVALTCESMIQIEEQRVSPKKSTRQRADLEDYLEIMPRRTSLHKQFTDPRDCLLKAEALSVKHPQKENLAVNKVDLELIPGEILGLVGPSGCGKTTLARALARLIPLESGIIIYKDSDPKKFRQCVQIVFQSSDQSLNPSWTIEDLILEAITLIRPEVSSSDRQNELQRLLKQVGLDVILLGRKPTQLSGGQKQRVAIARALAANPRILICDEPVSALDSENKWQILKILTDLVELQKLSCLLISHDLTTVETVSDRIAVMSDGKIIETGPTTALLKNPKQPLTIELLKSRI